MRIRGSDIQRNIVDRAVEFLDPVRGKRRLQARIQLALVGQWTAGAKDRSATKNWNPFGGSADEDTLDDLPTMRSRSRDLQRRDPQALGATNTNVTSVVGTGLSLRARPDATVLHLTPEKAQAWRANTEARFGVWAGSAIACDLEGTNDLYQQTGIAFRSAMDSGDVIALLPYKERRGSRYKLKVHLVEADRLCNEGHAPDTETLTAGVERDTDGMPHAYHIAKQHPGSMTGYRATEWDIVPAFGQRTGRRNVIHLFDKRRPGQTRGVPYLAPVIEILKQVTDYTYAELHAAVISAAFTVFIETESGGGLDLDDTGAPQSGQPTASGSDIGLRPGAIVDLAKGEKPHFANPQRPNSAADVFLQAMMRRIGVALELPYEVLVKHFTASYSAARAALIEAWRYFKGRRAWLATMFLQPIYEAWLEEAVAMGDVIAPGFFDDPLLRAAWCGSEWIGDAPGQIDPLKEIEAAIKRVDELQISTRTDEAMELRGADWWDVVERLAMEQRALQTIRTEVAPPATPLQPPQQQQFPSDRNTDEEDE